MACTIRVPSPDKMDKQPLRGCLKSPEMSVFDRCRATSEGTPIALSPLKSKMPIFTWIPCQAARETFQTASETVEALLDTGFDGDVIIPEGLMTNGKPPDSYLRFTLADQ